MSQTSDEGYAKECSPWSNRALRDGRRAVHVRRTGLQEAVPMDRRAFDDKVVGNGYFDPVAPVGFDHWSWELAVGDKHWE